ncbi:MAG TPA: class I lanthipeptide [Candidatus Kapabacteria bacterium]|nr:class I lanthipeptide [Candidatus Kapabacteria bacterium]
MKKKQIEKKLRFGKETIANLDKKNMSKLLGGSVILVTDIHTDCKRPSAIPPCP